MEGYSVQSVVSSLLINMLNIVALFLILRALVYRPVRKFLQARSDRVVQEETKARQTHAEAEQLHAQYEAELKNARADVEKQTAEMIAKANDAVHAIQVQAETEAGEILNRSRQQAQREHDDAMHQLRHEIADIAVEISSRVLAREVTQKDNADIIDAYFQTEHPQGGSGAKA